MADGTEKNAPVRAHPPSQQLLGKVLLSSGVVDAGQLEAALEAAAAWNVPLGQAVLALGYARPPQLYRTLADHLRLPFVDVLKNPPPADLFDGQGFDFYIAAECIPVAHDGARTTFATPDPLAAAQTIAHRRSLGIWTPTGDIAFAITSRLDVLWTLQAQFDPRIEHNARDALTEHDPINSAQLGLTRPQRLIFLALVAALAGGFTLWPFVTAAVLNLVFGLFFIAVLALRAASIPIGLAARAARPAQVVLPDDADLPVYTIIVPLFREADVLPLLAEGLRALDYPRAKLDIKLVLEADDLETVDKAKSLGLESYVEFIRVPPSSPRTKPKACNYALHFARGEYVVIFDAEDQPEPLQLKKAVAGFAKCGDDVACLQAPLTYFNANENWLTRQFTIEFNMWFELLLPTAERLGMPIPLGGTSTHFRIDALRSVGAWDPYNVTEDADLGIRLAGKGYKCGILDSTTYEEANCQTGNWLRQRSRWIKGYAQTWLVHMRRPVELYRTLGGVGFLGFHLLIGGSIASALLHPLIWLIALAGLVVSGSALALMTAPYVPALLVALNAALLGGGYIVSVAAGIAAVRQRPEEGLVADTFSMPFYWPLISAGAYLAMWQLITNPFYWEKTRHAISKASRARLAQLARHSRNND